MGPSNDSLEPGCDAIGHDTECCLYLDWSFFCHRLPGTDDQEEFRVAGGGRRLRRREAGVSLIHHAIIIIDSINPTTIYPILASKKYAGW